MVLKKGQSDERNMKSLFFAFLISNFLRFYNCFSGHFTSKNRFYFYPSEVVRSLSASNKPQFQGEINLKNNTFERIIFGAAEIFGYVSAKLSINDLVKEKSSKITYTDFASLSSRIKEEYERIFWATGFIRSTRMKKK